MLFKLTHHHCFAPFVYAAEYESKGTENVAKLWKNGLAASL
jgi:hypothetical protein